MSRSPGPSAQVPVYHRIAMDIAASIADGRLRPGDALPITADLARQHQVTLHTAQRAYTLLKRRGLVRRSTRRGTVVSATATATSLGLVIGDNIMAHADQGVYRMLWSLLIEGASRRGQRIRIYPLPARHQRNAEVVGEIESDLAAGRVRALLALSVSSELDSWLRTACPVPWVNGNSAISVDAVARLGYGHLLARGYRRIAWLAPWRQEPGLAGIAAACAAQGVEVPADPVAGYANTAEAGYAWGRSMAALAPALRPEAVLIGNDNACQGVIYACLEAGMRLPGDLALVTHANQGIRPYFPLDLTRVEFAIPALAEAMLDAVQAGSAHPAAGSLAPLDPVLIPGATCPPRPGA